MDEVQEEESTQQSRTIFCGNLSEKVTDELLYELFLQVGPIDRISMPKDKDGNPKAFGFVEYKHQESVPYALSVFAGTKLFNRELRLNPRGGNNGNANRPLEPQPLLAPTHQFQMANPSHPSMAALRYGAPVNTPFNDMMPRVPALSQMNDIGMLDFNVLQGLSAQLLHGSLAGNEPSIHNSHAHQSKMLHRDEYRSHHQNSNYGRRDDYGRDRDRDRDDNRRGGYDKWNVDKDRNRRHRDRSRSRSRERSDGHSGRNQRRHNRDRR